MKEEEVEIHRNSKDIIQKLLLFSFPIGTDPLAVLGEEIGKIISVEPTDIVGVRTIDDAADVLFRLENDVILHIEVQTDYSKKDIFRFAEYDAYLLNEKYLDENVMIQTVVIFTHRVDPANVRARFDKGSIKYEYTAICLKNQDGDAYLKDIIEKIRHNPNYVLTPEDRLLLMYIPLMNSKNSFNDNVNTITETLRSLNDIRQVFNTIGTMLAFHHKKLSEDVKTKLWEVLQMGGAIFEEFKKDVIDKAREEGKEEGKHEQILELAKKMIKRGDSDQVIIDFLEITNIELREIKRQIN
jgi:hypothetical protein